MKRLSLLLLVAGLLSACGTSRYGGAAVATTAASPSVPSPVSSSGYSGRYGGGSRSAEVSTPLVKRKSVVEAEQAARGTMVDGVPVQKVAFRPGVSSATVERMAYAQECRGGQGAGLVTEPGPVEVYRMACANGKVFMARCEMRQCTAMSSDVAGR